MLYRQDARPFIVKPIIIWTLGIGEDTILASGGEGFLHETTVYIFSGFTIKYQLEITDFKIAMWKAFSEHNC